MITISRAFLCPGFRSFFKTKIGTWLKWQSPKRGEERFRKEGETAKKDREEGEMKPKNRETGEPA